MLHKCANQACSAPFRRLREGKLFQVETEYYGNNPPGQPTLRKVKAQRHVEHFWLCDACSPFVTLTFDRERGVVTVPLPGSTGQKTVTMIPLADRASALEQNEQHPQVALREVRK